MKTKKQQQLARNENVTQATATTQNNSKQVMYIAAGHYFKY